MTERQIGIEQSHLTRYLLAKSFLKEGDTVLDVFCGTGYGSKLMSSHNQVTAFDKYDKLPKSSKVEFICAEYPNVSFIKQFDMVVCFEAIEHIDRVMAKKLLSDMRTWLKVGGILLISSPNQLNYPYDAEKIIHHKFHYTPSEMTADLFKAGFFIKEWFNQKEKFTYKIDPGFDGRYMIAKCT